MDLQYLHSAVPISPAAQARIPALQRMDLITVRLPYLRPFSTSVHTWAAKEALLLRVEADGVVGWGECVADPDPFYASETTQTVRHVFKQFLLPLVQPGLTLGELLHSWSPVRGHGMAKAMVENALLDLIARRQGLPLHRLLGLAARPIQSGVALGIQPSIPALLDAVADAMSRPYHRVKLKIMQGKDVEWVAAVREAFPDLALMADANGDYRLEHAPILRALDAFNLSMIEQPLSYSDIVQHAALQSQLATPLCLDESIHDLDDARSALALKAARIINIKQGRVGGMIESLRIAALCEQAGIGVWSGGMDETGIGRAFNMQLQAAPGFTLPGDTAETSRYFKEDIVDQAVVLADDGYIAMPGGPGIGVTVLEERVTRYTLNRERIL
ncbi:o-succinylbenzoate synthase MenC [Janthinobacterium sp. HH01]|uniref:o-succinylbenzoate synthase n=1 Tax=Janthinobacterium sp. HH01 TaxID=1198452 RepID=UPI0002AEA298|nr:o-succinylbenzoate synthase [Janthinobacterium sp. HH01]ELX10847.1 o-succinylbenzoate synthase MenC [Janthinobacterium sp. HH01]